MNRFFLIICCAMALIHTGCDCCSDGPLINIKAECVVVDMDNKPLKNRKVDLFSSFRNNRFEFDSIKGRFQKTEQTMTTDDNGKVVFNYTWRSMDAANQFFHIVAQDDSLFKSVNHLTPPSGKSSFAGVIQMDSLVPFRVRFRTNRDDAESLKLEIMNYPPYTSPQNLMLNPRKFLKDTIRTVTPKLDTTISIRVYKKADFMSWNIMYFKNDPKIIGNMLLLIKQNTDRNAVFLQEF